MDVTVLVYLTGGLLLGWSLGANDAANVFGTAVGTRMVSFVIAASICSVFVVLGAVISGAGAAETLGRLGSINTLAGSFMVATAAAGTIYVMVRAGLPASTSQAIVGAIVGWNVYSGSATDMSTLATIAGTWVACPLLAAVFAVLLYQALNKCMLSSRIHLVRIDLYTRIALVVAGAFGAYSLGANNIANVMGVFVPVSPFTSFEIGNGLTITSTQQLFFLGAVAIAVGVFTYSKRMMYTVGRELLRMSPTAAIVVVVAHSLVLFIFASQGLQAFLREAGLPAAPLVPVSSSQAIIGGIVGIGLMRGGREIRWRVLGSIALGWVTVPLAAGVVCYVSLFFLENVFNQQVYLH